MVEVSEAWKEAHEQMLLPESFVEIAMELSGTSYVFDKTKIIEYTHEQGGDLISRELSYNKITFTLDNLDGTWDVINPDGLWQHLDTYQKIVVRYGLQLDTGVEWIPGGTFYLMEQKVSDDGLKANFVAGDAFAVLRNTEFTRYPTATTKATSASAHCYSTREDSLDNNKENAIGEITAGTTVTVYEIACELDWGSAEWNTSSAWEPAYRTNLGWFRGFVEPALNFSVCYISEIIPLVLNNLPFSWESYNEDVISTNVRCKSIVENTSGAECIQFMCNLALFAHWQDSNGLLHFEQPSETITDYVITQNKSYLFPEIELPPPLGKITFTGRHWYNYDYTATYTLPVGEGEDVVVDNPYCITNMSGTPNATWVAAYTPKTAVSGEFRVDPRLELFDVIQVEDKYGNFHNVMLTYIKYTYTGSFHGSYTGVII